MNVPDLYSKVALFEGLSPADRIAISKASTLRSYRRGERIVTQGQPGDSFFVLVKGRVAVSILSPEGREVVLELIDAKAKKTPSMAPPGAPPNMMMRR